jgi:hypothetical protein
MKKLSRSGFTMVEVLLLIAAAGLIVFTGIYVYKAKQNTDKTLKPISSASAPKNSSNKVQGSRFDFKELGIWFTKPDDLAGLNYSAGEIDTSMGKAMSAYLAEASLIDIYKECVVPKGQTADETASFAGITRFNGTYNQATFDVTDGAFVKQFDGFYITYGTPNGLICSSEDETLNDKWAAALQRTQTLFYDAFKATVAAIE